MKPPNSPEFVNSEFARIYEQFQKETAGMDPEERETYRDQQAKEMDKGDHGTNRRADNDQATRNSFYREH